MGKGRFHKDMAGQVFGMLTLMARAPNQRGHACYICKCACKPDAETIAYAYNLKNGHTTSCGCKNHSRDGASKKRVYRIWIGMLHRCEDPFADNYRHYGGKGVKICERWHDFNEFYADMGDAPSGRTLDRVDNHKGYAPDNCRWATRITQMRNKSTNCVLEFRGEKRCLAEWAEITGLRRQAIQSRLSYGWSVDRALSTPTLPPNNGRAKNLSVFNPIRRCTAIRPPRKIYRPEMKTPLDSF